MDMKSFVIGYQAGKNAGGGSSADVRYVTFMTYDGSIEYGKKAVAVGDDCADPIDRGIFTTPIRESTAQYNYAFAGWSTQVNGGLDSNALKAVEEDRTVYANFEAVLRCYTITYLDDDGVTVLSTEPVAYGSVPSYTPSKDKYDFVAWVPALVAVTSDASYTATWKAKAAFATATWAEIAEICEAGKAAETFAVGDTKTVKIGTTYCGIRILGFDHDDLVGGGKASISMALTSVWNETIYVSVNSTSRWSTSNLRTKVAGLLDGFPSDLKAIVKPVTKKTRYSSTTLESTTESLWPLSITELGCSDHGEGSVYDYYGPSYSINSDARRALSKEYWARTLNAAGSNWSFITTAGASSGCDTKSKYLHFGFCI